MKFYWKNRPSQQIWSQRANRKKLLIVNGKKVLHICVRLSQGNCYSNFPKPKSNGQTRSWESKTPATFNIGVEGKRGPKRRQELSSPILSSDRLRGLRWKTRSNDLKGFYFLLVVIIPKLLSNKLCYSLTSILIRLILKKIQYCAEPDCLFSS